MATDQYDISIINYDKFKGRADVSHNSWFRLSNRFLEDPDFFEFSADEKLTWIYILSLGSQKNSAEIKLNLRHAVKVCGLDQDEIQSALEKLKEIKCIAYYVTLPLRARNEDVLETSSARALHNITDKTEQTDKHNTISTEPKSVAVVTPKTLISISENKQVEVKADLIKAWADTYPKEYLELELKKARNWLLANSAKAPKSNFGRFFNSWFDRGWETYRKTLPSNTAKTSVDELMNMMGWDNANN